MNEKRQQWTVCYRDAFPSDGQAFHSVPRKLHNGLKIAISSSKTRTPGTDVVVVKHDFNTNKYMQK